MQTLLCALLVLGLGATVRFVGGAKTHRPSELWSNPTALHCIKSLITTAIDHDLLSSPAEVVRSTKIVCTMGPACWSEESLGKLLDAGMNIARFNFSHGDHAGHGEVLERFRKVAAAKGSSVA
ncbi:pyruvate kinase, partial [Baffinella frigidus]